MDGERPDWYLREWLAHFEKKQAALTNELGWNKSKANQVWHSRQEYRRETVNEIADWLEIEPYELLMDPDDALALRKLRESARQIVASERDAVPGDDKPRREPDRPIRRRTGS